MEKRDVKFVSNGLFLNMIYALLTKIFFVMISNIILTLTLLYLMVEEIYFLIP